MKIELLFDGYIPATAIVIAEVPDDATEDELNAIRDDLLVNNLEEDGFAEVNCLVLGEKVPSQVEAEVQVMRIDGQLFVESR